MSRVLRQLFVLFGALLLSHGPQVVDAQAPVARKAAKPIIVSYSPSLPSVMLTAEHAAMCHVMVGDAFPAIELPRIDAGPTKLATFAGEKATVVLFWKPGDWMSRAALQEVGRIAAAARDSSVGVIGVVEGLNDELVEEELFKAGAKFSHLHDGDGSALAQVGSGTLPRLYVFDGSHRIAWFDIEFSEATRRELQQALAALAAGD
jgi:hypothetical protein